MPPGNALTLLATALLLAAGRFSAADGLTATDLSSLSTKPAQPPVTAELFADTSAVSPGETFTVGILLKMADDWHVYWRNPGEGGLATELKVTAPEGFEVGPVQWPTPERFAQPGAVLGFGYSDSVMLTVRLTAPDDLDSDEVEITAVADYLACKDVCIPGAAELTMKLLVEEEPREANEELFAKWRERLPIAADAENSPAEVTVEGRIPPADSEGTFEISLRWKQPAVTDVEFFPASGASLDVKAAAVRTADGRTRIRFRVHILEGVEKPPRELDVVVAFKTPEGERRGLAINVPLRPDRETHGQESKSKPTNHKEPRQ